MKYTVSLPIGNYVEHRIILKIFYRVKQRLIAYYPVKLQKVHQMLMSYLIKRYIMLQKRVEVLYLAYNVSLRSVITVRHVSLKRWKCRVL